jgi:UPF0716 family protein affecting phage T7 exclusion
MNDNLDWALGYEIGILFVVYLMLFLCSVGTPCFRGHGRRDGERRRKSVRGCIVSPDLSVLNLVIVKQGNRLVLLALALFYGLAFLLVRGKPHWGS